MSHLKGGLIQMSLKGDTSMSPGEIRERMIAAHLPLIEEAGRDVWRMPARFGVVVRTVGQVILSLGLAREATLALAAHPLETTRGSRALRPTNPRCGPQ